VEETFDMARAAIRGYLESLEKDGLLIPEEREPGVSSITVDFTARV
jgi:predicted RNase H-like HicB family nuclease